MIRLIAQRLIIYCRKDQRLHFIDDYALIAPSYDFLAIIVKGKLDCRFASIVALYCLYFGLLIVFFARIHRIIDEVLNCRGSVSIAIDFEF